MYGIHSLCVYFAYVPRKLSELPKCAERTRRIQLRRTYTMRTSQAAQSSTRASYFHALLVHRAEPNLAFRLPPCYQAFEATLSKRFVQTPTQPHSWLGVNQ